MVLQAASLPQFPDHFRWHVPENGARLERLANVHQIVQRQVVVAELFLVSPYRQRTVGNLQRKKWVRKRNFGFCHRSVYLEQQPLNITDRVLEQCGIDGKGQWLHEIVLAHQSAHVVDHLASVARLHHASSPASLAAATHLAHHVRGPTNRYDRLGETGPAQHEKSPSVHWLRGWIVWSCGEGYR